MEGDSSYEAQVKCECTSLIQPESNRVRISLNLRQTEVERHLEMFRFIRMLNRYFHISLLQINGTGELRTVFPCFPGPKISPC